jgi:hypothetical protein
MSLWEVAGNENFTEDRTMRDYPTPPIINVLLFARKHRTWAPGGTVTRPDFKFHLSAKWNLNAPAAVKMVSFQNKQKYTGRT